MRVLARIGYTLASLALVAPAATAGMPVAAPGPYNAGKKTTSAAKPAGRLCGDCQRAKLMAEKGVNVPPPPPLPPGSSVRGGACSRCGRPAVVMGGPLKPSRTMPSPELAVSEAPGRAVAGDSAVGFVSNGMDPAPIGMYEVRAGGASIPTPPAGGRDAALMTASATTTEPVGMAKANRPHVVSHLLGVDGIGRDRKETRERRRRESHAMIPYGQAPEQVHDVPASMVFGRNAR